MTDWEGDPTEDLQLGCNFLRTWRTEGKHNIEMHCEMATHDDSHLWRIVFGLTLYATLAERAIMILRGVSNEETVAMPEEDDHFARIARAVVAHLVRGPIGGATS